MRKSDHSAHPLHLNIIIWVAEEATNEHGGFILANIHHCQAIASMPEFWQIEVCIARVECCIPQTAQENDSLVILHPLAAEIDSNLPRRYAIGFQQESLAFENVLVQNNQA
jgi:hypothetical protein